MMTGNLIKTKSFSIAIYAKGNPQSEKLALVLPGKLDTKDYSHMRSHVDYLANLGYLAASFDPPGTWGSPGDISLYTMTNYIKAVDELIEYYGNKPTFIMGHSRGGAIAAIASAKNPNIISFVSIFSSFGKKGFLEREKSEWKERGYVISKRDGLGDKQELREFRLPYSFYEDQIKYNLTDDITNSTKPKLFMLGKKDTLVLPDRVREAYSLYSEPKRLYEIDSEHDYRYHPKLIEEVNNYLGKFLAEKFE